MYFKPFALLLVALSPAVALASPNIPNPDFELGMSSGSPPTYIYWSQSSSNGYTLISPWNHPSLNNASAWLGGAHNEVSEVSQTVTLQYGILSLEFDLYIESSEVCGNDYDVLEVSITNDDTTDVYSESFDLCSGNASSSWTTEEISVVVAAAEQMTLSFKVTTDHSVISSAYIDNIVGI